MHSKKENGSDNQKDEQKEIVEANQKSQVVIHYTDGETQTIHCYRSNVREGCLEISWEELDKSRRLHIIPWHRISFVEIFSKPRETGV